MKAKIYNTPEYRNSKRVVAFVDPSLKKIIKKAAKINKRSVSKEIAFALMGMYAQ